MNWCTRPGENNPNPENRKLNLKDFQLESELLPDNK